MAEILFTHVISIPFFGEDPTGPDRFVQWRFGSDNPVATGGTVHSGDDDLLDAGVDFFGADVGNSSTTYSGYTIDVGGNIYAIFRTAGDELIIPYDKARQDLSFLAEDGGRSTGYTPTGAQVFNCFATGTRIATPDGDKPIEMLRAGEKVLTHDGRSTPVIWRARQSITNPSNLSVGRGPVRIEAGALGPNLPDAPLTVTADHALLFGDMLINAGTLVNGTTIRLLPLEEMPARFNYWHVELEKHECIVANGVPAESFIDYVGRVRLRQLRRLSRPRGSRPSDRGNAAAARLRAPARSARPSRGAGHRTALLQATAHGDRGHDPHFSDRVQQVWHPINQ